MHVNDLGCMGSWRLSLEPSDEINNYSVIAGVVARTEEFDIIHAHDWLTFPAGIHARRFPESLSATCACNRFRPQPRQVNPRSIPSRRDGMDNADCIMCERTHTPDCYKPVSSGLRKCFAMHNASVSTLNRTAGYRVPTIRERKSGDIPRSSYDAERSEYFVEAANMVLHRTVMCRFMWLVAAT